MDAQIYVILDDGTTVSKQLYDAIFQEIDEVIPAMDPGMAYTAEQLCGKEFWQQLAGNQRQAGKCVSSMVKTGLLPLVRQGCEHQYPRKYMRK